MKKVEKFKLSMTMAVCFIVALFATSCSNDYFFGFDSGYSNFSDDYASVRLFATEPFLSISTSNLEEMDDADFNSLSKAITRIESSFNNGTLINDRGMSYNLSDTLFSLAHNTIVNTRNFFTMYSSSIKRVKNLNGEGNFYISGYDCVGQAIAYALNLNVDSINNILANSFPNYYSSGIPCNMIETAFSICGSNFSKFTNIAGYSGNYDVLLIKPISGGDSHAMNILSIHYNTQSLCYTVYARDKNFSSVFFYVYGDCLPQRFYDNSNGFFMNSYYHLTKN